MIDYIIDLDKSITIYFNSCHSPFFDFVMHAASNGLTWIPLFALLLYLLYKNFSTKEFLLSLLFIAILITLTDQISFQIFKNGFERLRPCHEPDLFGIIKTFNGECGGDFGFISSHATNYFGLAVFNICLLSKKYKILLPLLLLWALIISYSRIYLGVHYFGDVLGGCIVGSLIGLFVYKLFKYIDNRYILKNS